MPLSNEFAGEALSAVALLHGKRKIRCRRTVPWQMDLLSIARKLWRYKLVTLPVVALVLVGVAYVVAVKQPVYQAQSSYVLINPPLPPTDEEIARDPALARVHADNPLTRFSDQSVVVEILASAMASQSAKEALVKEGADPRYTVASASAFGYSSPIVQVTAEADTSAAAIASAKLVGGALVNELERRQQGVDDKYRIHVNQVDPPDHAELLASGQLRALVGVLALGAVLLFIVVSVADALTTLRRERVVRASPGRVGGSDAPWSPYEGRSQIATLEPGNPEFHEESDGSDRLVVVSSPITIQTRRSQLESPQSNGSSGKNRANGGSAERSEDPAV
jgi:hypothetical protein